MDTVTRSAEAAESSIDAFIARHHNKRVKAEGERPAEEMYMESVRRYEEAKRQQSLWERLRFHEGQARRLLTTLAEFVAHHEAEAEKYAELLGVNEPKGEAA